jgi:hypothetical protein
VRTFAASDAGKNVCWRPAAWKPLNPGEASRRRLRGSSRLGPATRLFDLPAPEQSLKVQAGGQQCGDEID